MSSLPLLPDFEPRQKTGGYRPGCGEGESLREGHNVEYFTLGTRSLLNRVASQRSLPFRPGHQSLSRMRVRLQVLLCPIHSRIHGTARRSRFREKIFVKQHAAELLRQELRRVKPGEGIAIGTATDPYQPAERRFEVTLAILEELARHSGWKSGL